MLGEILTNTRKKAPLIHCITNYVTANQCANILYACGASPCMADDKDEVADIVNLSSGVLLNLGTLNPDRFEAMIIAGTAANRLGKPVIVDPVGAGSSKARTEAAMKMISLIKPTVIRGNASEIKVLAGIKESAPIMGLTKGVDSPAAPFMDSIRSATALAKKTGSVVIVSGQTDMISDGKRLRLTTNGDPMQKLITGAGCMYSALLAAYVASNPDDVVKASLAASCAIGVSAQIARSRMGEKDGNMSFCNYLIDAVYNLSPEMLDSRANYIEKKEDPDEDQ